MYSYILYIPIGKTIVIRPYTYNSNFRLAAKIVCTIKIPRVCAIYLRQMFVKSCVIFQYYLLKLQNPRPRVVRLKTGKAAIFLDHYSDTRTRIDTIVGRTAKHIVNSMRVCTTYLYILLSD